MAPLNRFSHHASSPSHVSRRLGTTWLATLLFISAFFAPCWATAEPIILVVSPSALAGTIGEPIVFTGTITNLTGQTLNATDLFLNFGGFDPDILTISQLLGSPDFVLPNNTFSPTVELFSVIAGPGAFGAYVFDVFLQDVNNTFSNTVVVEVSLDASPPPPIPEPSTLLCCMVGLAGGRWLRRQARRQSRS